MTYTTGYRIRRFVLVFITACVYAGNSVAVADLVMETHGAVSFAPYIHGIEKNEGLYPGYRAEFSSVIDLYRRDRLVLTGISADIRTAFSQKGPLNTELGVPAERNLRNQHFDQNLFRHNVQLVDGSLDDGIIMGGCPHQDGIGRLVNHNLYFTLKRS